ncbi:hypothetical protein ACFE04_007350 [Oxalis oulophora]
MSKYHYLCLYLLVFFGLLVADVKCDEREVLLNLKTSLQISNPDVFTSWNSSTSVCNFTGVICSDGLVSEIDISYKQLAGRLPFDSICQLQGLKKLSLGFNYLYGHVTNDLNKCVMLQYLDISNNGFTGEFPDLSELIHLQHLYLSNSGFSGLFPWKSLLNMTGLVTLSIGDNFFDPSEFPREILNLKKLNWLYLANCSIRGKIPPEIGNLAELRNLELSDNELSGEIPAEIAKLRNLWQLELYTNNLSGKLPAGLRNLIKLERFDASQNKLEGDLSELRFLTSLVSLQLFKNQFTGQVPVEFGQFKNLVNLSLYTNKLTGTLPRELGSWSEFDYIDVSENYLTGPIPPDMCKQGKMTRVLMLKNKFTGPIPESYANCKTLKRFRVSSNSLSGMVPAGIWGLPNLETIDLSFNQFEGPITSDIKHAKCLGNLLAENNNLSGDLPPDISQATSLVKVDLSYNQISGKLPEKMGDLKKLSSLTLQNNRLSGSIPDSLGYCDSLSDMNMAHNSLSGNIPNTLGFLPTLNSLNLSGNHLYGRIPESLSSLRLSLFDLSLNDLSGRIPQSLYIQAYNGSFAGNPHLCSSTVLSSIKKCSSHSEMSNYEPTLIICLVLGTIIILTSLSCFLFSKKRKKDRVPSLREESWNVKSFHMLAITENEILDSIKPENVIGKGGSGNVYKVVLSDGKELAVKHIWDIDCRSSKLSQSSVPMLSKRGAKSKEFHAEVQSLSSIRHVNVVKLYCSITSEDSSMLVYEYLPNGSLWDRLHGCEKMELKYGYTYKINEKSDVYSFGVVLMELVTGKKPIEPQFGENKDIVSWAGNKMKSREAMLSIIDSRIAEAFKEDAIKVLRIAILCTSRHPTWRPTMRSVVQMLEEVEPSKLMGIVITKE